MDSITRKRIEQIHNANRRLVIAVSGGGSGAIAELLAVPGGSKSLLEAVVPYSAAAMDDWLGATPDQYCSERTARAMAMAAFMRARKLAPDENVDSLIGVGCTASLVSDRPKRGAHRIHIAWQTAQTTSVEQVELTKGARDRSGEEQIAAAMLLRAIATAANPDSTTPTTCAQTALPGEKPQQHFQTAPPEWTELLLGKRDVVFKRSGEADALGVAAACGAYQPSIVFPGAFNPLHAGHRQMAKLAPTRIGEPIWFELSITNVDKPPLDYIEIERRLDNFCDLPIVLTRAARFTEKAKLFPGATFIVGADTLLRIADPRYYAGDLARVAAAIRLIAAQDCRFLVFGRRAGNRFVGLENLVLPAGLLALCDGVPESEFRDDISSTELRKRG